ESLGKRNYRRQSIIHRLPSPLEVSSDRRVSRPRGKVLGLYLLCEHRPNRCASLSATRLRTSGISLYMVWHPQVVRCRCLSSLGMVMWRSASAATRSRSASLTLSALASEVIFKMKSLGPRQLRPNNRRMYSVAIVAEGVGRRRHIDAALDSQRRAYPSA